LVCLYASAGGFGPGLSFLSGPSGPSTSSTGGLGFQRSNCPSSFFFAKVPFPGSPFMVFSEKLFSRNLLICPHLPIRFFLVAAVLFSKPLSFSPKSWSDYLGLGAYCDVFVPRFLCPRALLPSNKTAWVLRLGSSPFLSFAVSSGYRCFNLTFFFLSFSLSFSSLPFLRRSPLNSSAPLKGRFFGITNRSPPFSMLFNPLQTFSFFAWALVSRSAPLTAPFGNFLFGPEAPSHPFPSAVFTKRLFFFNEHPSCPETGFLTSVPSPCRIATAYAPFFFFSFSGFVFFSPACFFRRNVLTLCF